MNTNRLPPYAILSTLALSACTGLVGEPGVAGLDPRASATPVPSTAPSASPSPMPSATPTPTPMPTTPPAPSTPPDPAALSRPGALGTSGLRRLSSAELGASLRALFGVEASDLLVDVPEAGSTRVPFDNDFTAQAVSTSLVQALSTFADAYAARVVADARRPVEALAGCRPSGPGDRACFEAVVRAVGRRLLRRALAVDEVTRYAGLLSYAAEEQRFDSAVELLLAALVQHPEHLYRLETGAPSAADPGLLELDQASIATRLALLVTGVLPDTRLLEAAEAGRLADPGVRRAEAERLWATPEARAHWARFHAMWLGYQGLELPPTLSAELSRETQQLYDRVLFDEDRRWLDIFALDESYLSPALAAHYGLPAPAAAAWVPARGGGVLSHGTFLVQGAKFGDTSPTLRGARLFERVLCGHLGPPPVDVDTDNPPPGGPSACKTERYAMRQIPACAGCHIVTDDLGFGLENLGVTGQWRDAEAGRPACTIDGRGRALAQIFTGPRELGQVLSRAPEVERCATRQLFRYVVGRPEAPADQATLDALAAQLATTPRFREVVLALAASPALVHRVR